MTRTLGSVFAVAVLAVAGCGDQKPTSPSIPRTAPVRGSVLYKGKPIAEVRVVFHPVGSTAKSTWQVYGTTDKEGKFVVGTGAADNGAPPGDYQVTFKLVTFEDDANTKHHDTERDAWGGKYLVPSEGPKVTIRDGENALEPFRLD